MTSERSDSEISPPSVAPRPSRLAVLLHRVDAPVLVQFVKFGIVGISNTLLTLVVYTVLLKVFGVWYLAASAIGFAVGAINGFLLNRRWTFREHVGDALTPVRWGIVQSGGLAINEGLLYLLVHDAQLDKLVAQVCATAVVTITTFIVNRAWTFRMHAPVAADAPTPLAEHSHQ
jgi:putative flippase GtrA